MTTICVTFICDFLKHSIFHEKRSSIEINMQKKALLRGAKKKNINDKPNLNFIEEPLTVIHNVNKPVRYLHIEYNLLPKFIYKIDIVFWGTVAKVYTKDGVKAMKAIQLRNHFCIAFSIKHKFVLDEIDLLNFKSHTVTFAFCTNKNIVSASAKQEEEKKFYFFEDDINSKQEFAEAFEYDPNSSENLILYPPKSVVEYALSELLNFGVKNEILSILNIIPDYVYRKKVLFISQKIDDDLDIKCLNKEEQIIIDKENRSFQGKEQLKMSSDIKGKETATLLLKVPCELFFTDPNMALFELKESNKMLSGAFIIIDVKHLISEELKKKLNPIIVKIDYMCNVPVRILTTNKFDYLFAKYNICDETYTTNLRPVAPEMEFQEHNMVFLSEEKFQRFCGQISTGYFILQIMGRKRLEGTTGQLFNKSSEISKIICRKQEVLKYLNFPDKIAMIGVACFKLDLLYHIPHKFSMIKNCINPAYSPVLLNNDSSKLFHVTINTINIPKDVPLDANPLGGNELATYKTHIKVGMEICVPITNILRNLIIAQTYYNRIFLNLFEPTLAQLIISNVMQYNSDLLGTNDLLPNYLLKKEQQPKFEKEHSLITGFAIESEGSVIAFLEGNAKYIHDLIYLKISKEPRKSIFYLYNSDDIYEERYYTQLLNFRRIYNITLKYSLSTLFSMHSIFRTGVMPQPCQMALRKLYFFLKIIRPRDITERLLPTVQELISLDLEWGMPIYWPPKVEDNTPVSETVNTEI